MADPSFDVVSKVERQEVDNALHQAEKELGSRFDFRGTNAQITWAGDTAVTIQADTEERCAAAIDVFKEKLVKRGISLKALEVDEPALSGKIYKVTATIVQGISSEKAKQEGPPAGRDLPAQEPGLRDRAAVHQLPLTSTTVTSVGIDEGREPG